MGKKKNKSKRKNLNTDKIDVSGINETNSSINSHPPKLPYTCQLDDIPEDTLIPNSSFTNLTEKLAQKSNIVAANEMKPIVFKFNIDREKANNDSLTGSAGKNEDEKLQPIMSGEPTTRPRAGTPTVRQSPSKVIPVLNRNEINVNKKGERMAVNRTFTNVNTGRKYIVHQFQPAMNSPMNELNQTNSSVKSYNSYPKGIPKSFLIKPSGQTPEPYTQQISQQYIPQQTLPNPVWQTNKIQNEPNPNWVTNASTYSLSYQNVEETSNVKATNADPDMMDQQVYSPSDIYSEVNYDAKENLDAEESFDNNSGKRQSAFDRLGPQPKKTKLTINVSNTDQSIREVVNETKEEEKEEVYVPVHLRKEVLESTDYTVMNYRDLWPWKKNITVKSVTATNYWTVMIMETEQMEEFYEKDNLFIQVTVRGYPLTWTKEMVLDCVLDTVKGKFFIPCFIDFSPQECNFLVLRCRTALLVIHKKGFVIQKDDVKLNLTLSQTKLTLNDIDFIPKLVLRKRLSLVYDDESKLDLSSFTLKNDISNFIYCPLNQIKNQIDVVQMQSAVAWKFLTHLNLSHNKITTIEGFDLVSTTPKLQHLDLSFNCIDKLISLLPYKELSLHSIKLEGNPLCLDYVDASHYVKVLRKMFSMLKEIDGIPIHYKGELPHFIKNYCPNEARSVVEKFIDVYFPLLESTNETRAMVERLYHDQATLSVTYRDELRDGPIFSRTLFLRARLMSEGDTFSTVGGAKIAKLMLKWPAVTHDPFSFTTDVMHRDEYTTIFKVSGILKLTAESLADDEHLLSFSTTIVLHSLDGSEYKITNQMIYWDMVTPEYAKNSFRMTRVKLRSPNLELESEPDDDLKASLISILMKITSMNKKVSQRCLEQKNWNLKSALDLVIKLIKLNDLNAFNM